MESWRAGGISNDLSQGVFRPEQTSQVDHLIAESDVRRNLSARISGQYRLITGE